MEEDSPNVRGVSNVVGVIVIVGITLLLAVSVLAVTSVSPPASPPAAQVEFHQSGEKVMLSHQGGEPIEASKLSVEGGELVNQSAPVLHAGSEIPINPSDESVSIVYEQEGSAFELVETDVPLSIISSSQENSSQRTIIQREGVNYREIPVVEYGNKTREQYRVLDEEGVADRITDPFHLLVKNPDLANQTSDHLAMRRLYDNYSSPPEDRLSGPETPLEFNENGTAVVTVGSDYNSDVSLCAPLFGCYMKPEDIDIIEVPEGSTKLAVEVNSSATPH